MCPGARPGLGRPSTSKTMQPLARVSKKPDDRVPANIEPEAPSILPEIMPRVGAESENEEENSAPENIIIEVGAV